MAEAESWYAIPSHQMSQFCRFIKTQLTSHARLGAELGIVVIHVGPDFNLGSDFTGAIN